MVVGVKGFGWFGVCKLMSEVCDFGLVEGGVVYMVLVVEGCGMVWIGMIMFCFYLIFSGCYCKMSVCS